MLSLFKLLLRRSSASVIAIAVVGSVAGMCNSALLALISEALGDHASITAMMIAGYLALSMGVMVGNLLPELLLSRLSRSSRPICASAWPARPRGALAPPGDHGPGPRARGAHA